VTAVRPADNPFASHRIDRLGFRAHGFGLSQLQARLHRLGGRAAIVGPEGSGKTTLLEEIADDLREPAVLVRLPGSCSRPWATAVAQLPATLTGEHTVLVDGGEQLGPVAWKRFVRRISEAGGLIATLHRPGRLPILVECHTDLELLRQLVAELAPDHAPDLDPLLPDLFSRHDGNLRLCFRELFDICGGRIQVGAENRRSRR
jgi:hypothetical protein